jgi:hypothetical protein
LHDVADDHRRDHGLVGLGAVAEHLHQREQGNVERADPEKACEVRPTVQVILERQSHQIGAREQQHEDDGRCDPGPQETRSRRSAYPGVVLGRTGSGYEAHRGVVESRQSQLTADREYLEHLAIEPEADLGQQLRGHHGEEEREASVCYLAGYLDGPTLGDGADLGRHLGRSGLSVTH